jgi:hypothetical protein
VAMCEADVLKPRQLTFNVCIEKNKKIHRFL